jgi:RNA polymerase sigma-70 factor (ECF subfamily)
LLARGIQALPPAHRAVLVLREIEGLSYEEISRAVGCSLGTVMSRLFYARRKLQKVLGPSLEDLR